MKAYLSASDFYLESRKNQTQCNTATSITSSCCSNLCLCPLKHHCRINRKSHHVLNHNLPLTIAKLECQHLRFRSESYKNLFDHYTKQRSYKYQKGKRKIHLFLASLVKCQKYYKFGLYFYPMQIIAQSICNAITL